MLKITIIFISLLYFIEFAFSDTIYVPDNYAMIQEAIDASVNGDFIIVRSGTYVENINFKGKAITLTSELGPVDTIIDGYQNSNVVSFHSQENSDSVLDGFTIMNGKRSRGGGIFCDNADPLIKNNIISNNLATDYGGGIYCMRANAQIVNNKITNNKSWKSGGGFHGAECDPVLLNNEIMDNISDSLGGGITFHYQSNPIMINNVIAWNTGSEGGGLHCQSSSSPLIINNTFCYNSSKYGGAIHSMYDSSPVAMNCILWGNTASKWGDEVWISHNAYFTVSHSDLEGGKSGVYISSGELYWRSGMINEDPLFSDAVNGDFHLQQDPCQPGITNPCVDAGTEPAYLVGVDRLSTRTDNGFDMGMVDMGFHYGEFIFRLKADLMMLSARSGGTITFMLEAGEENANRQYLLLGGVSGTRPGTPLPGGKVLIPLNFDFFTSIVFVMINTPLFTDFKGVLDGSGKGNAQMHAEFAAPLPQPCVGTDLHFSFLLTNPFDFVSNPVHIVIIP